MLQIIATILFVVVLIKNIGKIRKEREYICQDEKRKHYYKNVTKWPYLYLLPLVISIYPRFYIDLLVLITIALFLPGLIFTYKTKRLFEKGYDRDERIYRILGTLFVMGISALIIIVAFLIINYLIVNSIRS